jgi:rhodanese-related sulfurtransferase
VSFFAENWILILVAFVSGGMLVWPLVNRSGGGLTVGTTDAVRLINREKGVLIDVSEANEYAQVHARGARHIPFGSLEGSKELPSNKALPLILMCPNGARAGRAATLLRKAGHANAVAVSGGTNAWRDAALPTDKAADKAAEKAEKAEKTEKSERSRSRRGRGKGEKAAGGAAAVAALTASTAAEPVSGAEIEPRSEAPAPPEALAAVPEQAESTEPAAAESATEPRDVSR